MSNQVESFESKQNRKTAPCPKWFENTAEFPELSKRNTNRVESNGEHVHKHDKSLEISFFSTPSYVKAAEKKADYRVDQRPRPGHSQQKVENWSKITGNTQRSKKPVDSPNAKKPIVQQYKPTQHQYERNNGYSDDDTCGMTDIYQAHKSERRHTLQTKDTKRIKHEAPCIDTRALLRRRQQSKNDS